MPQFREFLHPEIAVVVKMGLSTTYGIRPVLLTMSHNIDGGWFGIALGLSHGETFRYDYPHL